MLSSVHLNNLANFDMAIDLSSASNLLGLLQLANVLVKDLPDLQGAFLRGSRLAIFVVDVGNAESGFVAFGPFEVAGR